MISTEERYPKQHQTVRGKQMAYVEAGVGDPILFLHGNPTSSYLWRNIIPHLEGQGRCIAPDLIGMGDSDKLEASGPDSYRYVEHRDYLDDLIAALGVEGNVTVVGHDWGGALGFDWAKRHEAAVNGIAYMETIVMPMRWAGMPESVRPVFEGFRSPAGELMVLGENTFVERVLPGAVMRELGAAEMTVYRRPFLDPGESRRPTLTWPRQIPLDGEPADVHAIVADYSEWLARTELPKLFVDAEPGAIIRGPIREFCRGFKNQIDITVPGIHFVQEDAPDEIGRALADWHKTL